MKDFLKTLGRGILLIGLAAITVVMIGASCVDFFVELPTKTGFIAVCQFIFGCLRLVCGIITLYGLGCIGKNDD